MEESKKVNVLFVCTVNRMRSLTANVIFKDDHRMNVRSAGVAENAKCRMNLENLSWANYIFVMEKFHRNQIRKEFPEIYNTKRIICMYIPDDYDYMDDSLIEILKKKFEFLWATEINRV